MQWTKVELDFKFAALKSTSRSHSTIEISTVIFCLFPNQINLIQKIHYVVLNKRSIFLTEISTF